MPRTRDRRLSSAQWKHITRARRLGTGDTALNLDDATLAGVIGFLERDLATPGVLASLPDAARPQAAYYATDPGFPRLDRRRRPIDIAPIYLEARERIVDFDRVFEALCEIQKRRMKMERIRQAQALPDVDALAFRGLLASSGVPEDVLSSQLRVNKYLYDLDNRLAQESALLCTRLFANALGGRSVSGRASPILRGKESYRRRRSVDCIAGGRAYDFKDRMTEAPSRRARFADELAFPRDCFTSGYQPVLLALSQMPGDRSEELLEAYRRYEGLCFVGEDAWHHLREMAGPAMSAFIDTYLLEPLDRLQREDDAPKDVTIRFRDTRTDFVFSERGRSSQRIRIPRAFTV